MQPIGRFAIDGTEVSVAAFRRFVATTDMPTLAQHQGDGSVFEAGWVRKPSRTWRTPVGAPADERKPAVHIIFDETAAYCRWAGKRLPRDPEWLEAAQGSERITLGGSWWFGAVQMRRDHSASKLLETVAVYIGFRCAQDWAPWQQGAAHHSTSMENHLTSP